MTDKQKVPNKARRTAIIYRADGSTSVVQASAIQNVDELAYAIGFLAHHRLYKMSKDGGVSAGKALEVAIAFMLAAEAFQADVLDVISPPVVPVPDRISDLGAGTVKNPFGFVGG